MDPVSFDRRDFVTLLGSGAALGGLLRGEVNQPAASGEPTPPSASDESAWAVRSRVPRGPGFSQRRGKSPKRAVSRNSAGSFPTRT